jgi:hypothetical protein
MQDPQNDIKSVSREFIIDKPRFRLEFSLSVHRFTIKMSSILYLECKVFLSSCSLEAALARGINFDYGGSRYFSI